MFALLVLPQFAQIQHEPLNGWKILTPNLVPQS
jgi:hypothetical protein